MQQVVPAFDVATAQPISRMQFIVMLQWAADAEVTRLATPHYSSKYPLSTYRL